ncbi:nucleotidyltransferase domain-containing protein [Arthrobacter sp. KK5.5]|uniref:nucleotidyltransferase domain-containing protein n=1 Tax=Arthrobacter sp. KK5.5 TaxID=3373084 RepID=UPI003EE7760E
MRLQNPLASLAPTVDPAVLHVLARADTAFTVPAIHRLLPERHSEGGVRIALARLVAQGLVLDQKIGNTGSYRLNGDHLLADAVRTMANAKSELIDRIRRDVQEWPFAPLDIRLFGSAARGQMRNDSDIDLAVILPDDADEDETAEHITSLTQRISSWTGNDTRPLVYRQSEVRPDPLFDNVVADGIPVLIGSGWLERRLRLMRAESCLPQPKAAHH